MQALPARPRRRIHLNRTKSRLALALEVGARHLPLAAGRLMVRLLQAPMLAAYFVPGLPLRPACHDIARLAAARGHRHRPFDVYRQLVGEVADTARLYLLLYRRGRAALLPKLHLEPGQRDVLEELARRHGAFLVAVPHNPGSVVYASRLAEHLPCLVVSKRSKLARSNALYGRFFARLGVDFEPASRHDRVRLTRHLLRALDAGRVLVAPLDRIDRRREGVTATIFGQRVCFPAWAVRIAGRRNLPILPVYVRLEAGEARVQLGEPVLQPEPDAALQATLSQFEAWILERPGSWAFLGDKHWQRVLRQSRPA